MKQKVYIETSIVSYLTGRPSRNLHTAAWQSLTNDWWDNRRRLFDLYVSELVLEEAGRGNVTPIPSANYCQRKIWKCSKTPKRDMEGCYN